MSGTQRNPNAETQDLNSGASSGLDGLSDFFKLGPVTPGKDDLLGVDLDGVTVVRLIAEGGMGRVYEGVQQKPHRTVAVKVIRPGVVSPALMKRFQYEAEMLARLTHPGIAQIFSLGTKVVGRETVPYFVMEFIPGALSLTAYAQAHNLSTQDRVALFRKACDAVAHGHHKGVIHRDLKPTNILVDAAGNPKVIDFGVARSTDSDVALTTMHTDVGQIIGTLQYMCPEQFDANPSDIDVRADVYALGVVFYELLTGNPPYDLRKKAVFEAARVVREADPTPLSSLNKTIRRDLGTIASKCLEKERDRRYSNAAELEADVGRYLRGEPIAAHNRGVASAVVRLMKRNKVTVALLGVMVAMAALSAIPISVLLIHATRQRDLATQKQLEAQTASETSLRNAELATERLQEAEKERQRLSRSLTFITTMIQSANPTRAGKPLTVPELLETAVADAPVRFATDIQNKVEMLLVLADSLYHLDSLASAMGAYKQAYETMNTAEAGQTANDSWLQLRLRVLEGLDIINDKTGQFQEARAYAMERRKLTAECYGRFSKEYALSTNKLGSKCRLCGLYDEAKSLHEEAKEILVSLFDENSILLAYVYFQQAEVHILLKEFEEAERLLRMSLIMQEQDEKAARPHLIADNMRVLGLVCHKQGKLNEAEDLYRHAIKLLSPVVGQDHGDTVWLRHCLAEVLREERQFTEAAEVFESVAHSYELKGKAERGAYCRRRAKECEAEDKD
jgi:eukaryotic-like serine/threonine-protein kinase